MLRVHGASGLLTWAVRYNPMHFALLRVRVIMLGLTLLKHTSEPDSYAHKASAPVSFPFSLPPPLARDPREEGKRGTRTRTRTNSPMHTTLREGGRKRLNPLLHNDRIAHETKTRFIMQSLTLCSFCRPRFGFSRCVTELQRSVLAAGTILSIFSFVLVLTPTQADLMTKN